MVVEDQNEFLDNSSLGQSNVSEIQQIISLKKFILLSIFSFGLSIFWWIYKAWRFYQQKENLNINSAWRTMLGVFFLLPLLNKIKEFAKEKGLNKTYSPFLLYLGFIILYLISFYFSKVLPPVGIILNLFAVLFFIPPFKALNYAKEKSTNLIIVVRPSFNGWELAILIFGGLYWLLILLWLTLKIIK